MKEGHIISYNIGGVTYTENSLGGPSPYKEIQKLREIIGKCPTCSQALEESYASKESNSNLQTGK